MSQKTKDTLVVGLALFATFFGAGNLIFPPMLGFASGDKWFFTTLGFLITGAGLPVLGVIAVAKSGGDIYHMTKYIGKRFGKILGIIIVLIMGPLLIVPRTGATTFEMAVKPLFEGANPVISSVIFFIITWLFLIRPSGIIDVVGKVLTPVLLATMAFIIIKGILSPLGNPLPVGDIPAFSTGFLEGYQTMDALGSMLVGCLALNALTKKGYDSEKERIAIGTKAGLIAALGLALIYGGLMCIGALSGNAFPQDIDRIGLILGLTQNLLGTAIPLSIVVSLACLTTAIGFTAIAGEFFYDFFNKKIAYNVIITVCILVSGFISNLGVESIIKVAVPALAVVYPVSIVLIILNIFDKFVKNKNIYIGGVLGAFSMSFIDGIIALGIKSSIIDFIINTVPFAKIGFGWIIPACIGMLIANFIPQIQKSIVSNNEIEANIA
ncbi:MAG: branched-chain amino acid transport system II carrier protein [Proteocatella sp.]